MQSPVRAATWVVGYLLLALAPLLLSLIQLDPGRGFWVNLSVAAGFVGLSLMGLQFVLAARTVQVTGVFGPDVILRFHRQITVVIALLIFAHPLILMLWDHRFLALLNVITSPLRAKFAVGSVLLLAILIITSVWRTRLGLRYQVWQVLHTVLAVLVVTTALVHVLLIGYYVDQPWEKALWIAYSAAFVWIGVWVRVIKPIARWRRRWRVVELREQPLETHTLVLELVDPSSYGPRGFSFEAGQYAWIHTGSHPFALGYHPFSFSSSSERAERPEFTIKTEQGFTTTVHDLTPGHTVYLDGPWGQMCMDRHEGPGFVFVAAGVGITPMLSMLATMADRGDVRPCWLLLGNRSEDNIIGHGEVSDLQRRMPNLTVEHVISRPGATWTGRTGRIGVELLDEVLPTNRPRLQYFLCGSDAMMDSVQTGLGVLGVPADRVHAERFSMV